jgi:hypothetical protein
MKADVGIVAACLFDTFHSLPPVGQAEPFGGAVNHFHLDQLCEGP